MIIGIVGSRGYDDYFFIYFLVKELKNQYPGVKVKTGDAKGVDHYVIRACKELGVKYESIKADWKKYGKAAGMKRNPDIIKDCNLVFAIWDGKSRGTENSISICDKMGIQCQIVKF